MGEEDWRKRLRRIIKEKQTTQDAVSKAAGRSHGWVNSLLGSTKNPSVENFHTLARVLGVSAEWLKNGTKESEVQERLSKVVIHLDKDDAETVLRLAESLYRRKR